MQRYNAQCIAMHYNALPCVTVRDKSLLCVTSCLGSSGHCDVPANSAILLLLRERVNEEMVGGDVALTQK